MQTGVLEPLFFNTLKFFFLCPILFYRFVRLQGLPAAVNPMVPEMTGKADVLCAS